MNNKIRTVVGCEDENVANNVANILEKSNYADVVWVATDGNEVCQKIISLKPEAVFMEYNMSTMTGLDIMKETKRQLGNDNIPIFNLFADKMPREEAQKAYSVIGRKLNAWVEENDEKTLVNVLKQYQDFKKRNNGDLSHFYNKNQ